jgi:HK97 family phage major capsid protein
VKIKVKEKDLVQTYGEVAKALKDGKITLGQAREQDERIRAENPNIFSDHEQATKSRMGTPAVASGGGINWNSARDAANRTGTGEDPNDNRDLLQKSYEAIVKAMPNDPELDQIGDAGSQRELERFHELHDAFTILQSVKPAYQPRASKHWAQYARLAGKLTKKLVGENLVSKILTTGGSTTGAEFIPNTLSGTLVPFFRQALVLGTTFPHINMPTSPYKLPLEGTDIKPYLVAEASDDNPAGVSSNQIPARTPSTSSVTLTASGLKVRGVVSTEVEEDAIISEVGYIRMKLARAIAEGVDDCIVNGDTSGTHMDADSNTASDWRHAWLGLRKLTAAGTTKYNNTANKLTVAKILNVKRAFGKFGQMPADQMIIVSPIGLVHLMGDTNFSRWDAIGREPPLVNGQVGTLFGTPVIQSAYIRENLNGNGVYDGSTTTNTMAIVVHRPSFSLGDRRQITIQAMQDIQTDKFIIVATWRGTFARIQAETTSPQVSRNVGYVYNIDTGGTF